MMTDSCTGTKAPIRTTATTRCCAGRWNSAGRCSTWWQCSRECMSRYFVATREDSDLAKALARRVRQLRKGAPKEVRPLLPPSMKPLAGKRGKK
jgi:hypothetical protein